MTRDQNTNLRLERFGFYLTLACCIGLAAISLSSLYSTPTADSYLWWGDESWLMTEFRTQIQTGVFRHPYAFGSTLSVGNGLLFSNMWVPAILYGIPAALASHCDIVIVGRTVTAVIAIVLLCMSWLSCRWLGISRWPSLIAMLTLLSSRSYFLTSHSARYDILTSLVILLFITYLLLLRAVTTKQALVLGAITGLSFIVTIHVTIAIALPVFLAVIWYGEEHRLRSALCFMAGAAVSILVLLIVGSMEGHLSLFGASQHSSFLSNVQDIPILRPFSRSVQIANAIQKIDRFSSLALGVFIGSIAVVSCIVVKATRNKLPGRIFRSFVICLSAILAWFVGESSAPSSYLIYILPICTLGIAWVVEARLSRNKEWELGLLIIAVFILTAAAARDMRSASIFGHNVTRNNDAAVGSMLKKVSQDKSPGVLCFNPAVHLAMRDSGVRIMTTHVVEFPKSDFSLSQILRQNDIGYLLQYRNSIIPDYMREVGPMDLLARNHGILIAQSVGVFTDIGRSYFHSNSLALDTIQLYRLEEKDQ